MSPLISHSDRPLVLYLLRLPNGVLPGCSQKKKKKKSTTERGVMKSQIGKEKTAGIVETKRTSKSSLNSPTLHPRKIKVKSVQRS